MPSRARLSGFLIGPMLVVPTALAAGGQRYPPYAPIAADRQVDRLVQAVRFGEPGATAALAQWLARNGGAPVADRQAGYRALCKVYGVRTHNALRVDACRQADAAEPGGDDDAGMAAAFRDTPPIRAIGSARVPLMANVFGSTSAAVTVNGIRSSWFMDTGAEISVVSASTARRMGIAGLPGSYRVGTSTTDVNAPVAVIDALRIGDAVVENVPVLILPDSNLAIGGLGQIDGILGLQVFNAFRRVAWTGGGCWLLLGNAVPRVTDTRYRLYWHDEGLGVPFATPRGVMGAHLDTGANRTDLRAPGLALLSAAELAAGTEKTVKTGGAGGVVEARQRVFPSVTFRLGGVPVSVAKLSIAKGGGAARIGMDAVLQLDSLALDFERMALRAVPRRPGPGKTKPACAARSDVVM